MVMRKEKINFFIGKSFDLNWIFRFFNFIVLLILSSLIFKDYQINPYINNWSIILGIILCIQTHLFLSFKKSYSDPFVLLMSYVLIFFFELRIFTLALYPYQDVFLIYEYNAFDTNFALAYIILSNVFIYYGFSSVNLNYFKQKENIKIIKPKFGIFIFIISLLLLYLPQEIKDSIGFFYNNFFTPNTILLILAVYILVYRKILPSFYIKFLLIGALILFLLQTLSFSRGGIVTLIDTIVIVLLVSYPKFRIKRKNFFYIIFFLPIMFVMAFSIYAISTVNRQNKGDRDFSNLKNKIELINESRDIILENAVFDVYIGQAFSRAGYFDYSAEIIAHKKIYNDVFTVERYLKSIVDNLLTPGFNIFNQPKISNSLKYVYAGNQLGPMKNSTEIKDSYHSDQIGIYGEMYCIFGLISFPIYFFLARMLKKLYNYKSKLSIFRFSLKNIILLLFFHQLMNSFGLDWILIKTTITVISFYVLSKIIMINFIKKA